jgi:RHS repeat-associated protein
MRDGTRYRIENGRVSWIRDRNGNKVTVGSSGATDSLGRRVNIHTSVQDVAPYGLCDKIVFKGAGGEERVIRVSRDSLSNTLRAGYSIQTHTQLFPGLNGAHNIIPNTFDPPDLVSSVWLPDGRRYRLFYNSYGELARVELPTGGAIEYDYTPGSGILTGPGPNGDDLQIYRRVVERRTYSDGVTLTGKMLYSPVGITYKDANGVTLSSEGNSYISFPGAENSLFWPANLRLYGDWTEGRVNESRVGNGGAAMRTTTTNWQQRAPLSWLSWWNSLDRGPGYPSDNPANDPRAVETIITLNDSNQVAKTTSINPSTGEVRFDDYNNQLDVWEYDFGAGAPGPLIRRTQTSYLTTNPYQGNVNYATDLNIHIRNLPWAVSVWDGNGAMLSNTWLEYDRYDLYELQNCPGIVQHDGGFHPGYAFRGNLTKTIRWLFPSTEIATYSQHDIAGNVVKVIDPNGNATHFDFRDNFGSPDDPVVQSSENPANNAPGELGGLISYAFPFKITNALGHKSYNKFDYYLGKAALSEDANGVKSNVYFNDALDRPTRGVRAIGTSVASQTVFIYNDSDVPVNGHPARSITTISDKDVFGESNSGNGLKSVALYDELGRTWRSAAYEGSTWSITDTRFDALGRVSQVSNPYRAADPGSASPPSGLWTTTNYDALGRVTRVTTPDSAHVDTAYSGNRVTGADQAGKTRQTKTDALGRLVEVIEDPGGMGHVTSYLYDALDNLRKVTQGDQKRWFAYDSLSRLIRVKNPEQAANSNLSYNDPVTNDGNGWSMAYNYDDNNNLKERTDARGIVSKYYYDALNRNTGIDYVNGSQISTVNRFYDGPVNGKGRFFFQWTQEGSRGISRESIESYDPLGRPLVRWQHFGRGGSGEDWGATFLIQQTYDLAGNVKTMSYPSGRTVNYSYDQSGRLSSFNGNLGGSPSTYADTIGHNAAGQMIKERFGTNMSLYHNLHYNNRMQLVDTRLGDSATDEWNRSRGAITLLYGTTAVASGDMFANDTDNNGNLRRQLNYVPLAGGGHVIPQRDDYAYDALNRISSFTEAQMNSSGQWTLNVASQNFSYDRYGNRKVTSASGGVNNYNPTYDTTNNNNRIVGLGYDAAGNITFDPLTGGTMTYDAENRLLTSTNGSGGGYTYDAGGQRVRRITGGQETWHIYGIGGELLAEYAAGAAPSAAQKEYGYRGGQLLMVWDGSETGDRQLQWLVQDHLGSTRMVVDRSGSLGGVKRHDFLPFGEELSAGIGIRSAALGYGADSTRQKFTSKERDSETGLDYFIARYHSSVQGRFTSVDPENAGADPELPQTWNGYSYAINNPLTYSDPDGQKVKICDTNGNCTDISDDDARQYFFNKNYQKQVGYSVDRGKVYDSNNNLIGTYQNICCDSLPDWNAGAINYTREVLRDPRVWVGAAVGVTVGAVLGSRGGNTPRGSAIQGNGVTTTSPSRSAALRDAKLANDIPLSRGPDRIIKPNTDAGRATRLRSGDNVRLYEYTNSSGQKIWIREDRAASYGAPGGAGDQKPHFNSGPAGDQKNLNNHHYWSQ